MQQKVSSWTRNKVPAQEFYFWQGNDLQVVAAHVCHASAKCNGPPVRVAVLQVEHLPNERGQRRLDRFFQEVHSCSSSCSSQQAIPEHTSWDPCRLDCNIRRPMGSSRVSQEQENGATRGRQIINTGLKIGKKLPSKPNFIFFPRPYGESQLGMLE